MTFTPPVNHVPGFDGERDRERTSGEGNTGNHGFRLTGSGEEAGDTSRRSEPEIGQEKIKRGARNRKRWREWGGKE